MAKKHKKEHESVNFFVPMVDMMVSAIFIFIIIVMVLVLLIKSPTEAEDPSEDPKAAAAKGSETPIKPSIVENVVANQTSQEILVDDINKELLLKQGVDSSFDADKKILEIKLSRPESEYKPKQDN
jgi:biopolymer transport protein ExbD